MAERRHKEMAAKNTYKTFKEMKANVKKIESHTCKTCKWWDREEQYRTNCMWMERVKDNGYAGCHWALENMPESFNENTAIHMMRPDRGKECKKYERYVAKKE